MLVTYSNNIQDRENYRQVDFLELINEFSRYKKEVEELRAIHDPDPKVLQRLRNEKKVETLPVFYLSTYNGGRIKDENLISVTGAQIDFDHITDIQFKMYSNMFERTCYCAFKSPSADGLKVLVKYDNPVTLQEHELIYDAIAAKFKAITKLDIDEKTRPGGKACFISYYPEISINPNNVFNTQDFLNKLPARTPETQFKASKPVDAPKPIKENKKPPKTQIKTDKKKPQIGIRHYITIQAELMKSLRAKKIDFQAITALQILLFYQPYKKSNVTYKDEITGKTKQRNIKNDIQLIQVDQKKLAEHLNCSQSEISRSIKTLLDNDVIKIEKYANRKEGLSAVYRLDDSIFS